MICCQAMRARTRRGTAGVTSIGMALLLGLSACRLADSPPARPWQITVLQGSDTAEASAALAGLREGLAMSGLQPDRDYTLVVDNARGNAAAQATQAGAAARGATHTVVAIGTSALQAALAAGGSTPIVFTGVADPAGAGVRPASVWQRWLPFLFGPEGPPVTGAYSATGFATLLQDSRELVGGSLGAVVVGDDAEALAYRDVLRTAATWDSRHVEFEMTPAAGVAVAAATLCGRGATGLVALGDPATNAAFGDLARAARTCRIPVLGTLREHAVGGAVVALARDPAEAAREAGRMVGRLAQGESAGDIPIAAIPPASLIVNVGAAEAIDAGIPYSLVQRADEVLDE